MKHFKQLAFAVFFLMLFNQIYYSQVFKWAKGFGNQTSYTIDTDLDGNSYVTGSFNGTASFGTTTLTSSGVSDIFIAKYDMDGNCLWAKKAGGTSYDDGGGIVVDATGNSYVTGSFNGTAFFGTTTLTSSGYSDIFIAKYDTDGNCLWAKQAGGTDSENGYGISVDATGNSYITGYFERTATFGTTTLTSSGATDIFIAKYDTDGNCLWAKQAEGTSYDYGRGIVVDATGNSYVTGSFNGTASFGTTTLTSSGVSDIFIAKYDTDGNCLWAKQAGGTDSDNGYGISVDATGNSYVTGSFNGTATFRTTTLTSSGATDIFIAKYDMDGNCLWAKKAGGTSYDYGRGISVSENDIVNITGGIYGSATFGSINLSSRGGFITQILSSTLNITSPIGNEIWQTNTVHNITWNSVDDGNIKIEITTNNGTDWLTLQSSVDASLGNYTLTIPPFSNSSECKIRLTSLSYGNVSTSNAFTITSTNVPNLTITLPNTATKWNAGSSHDITWTLAGSVDNVKLEYTTNNGNNWTTIINSSPATNQSYSWVVPNTPSTFCRIRVSDVANSVLNDVSDALFSIANITITNPAQGDKWKAGISKNITWISTGVSQVNLYYSTNDGTNWTSITSNLTATNESYTWNVANVSSDICKIKIVDASASTMLQISSIFSIWQPVVSTQTPPLGQNTQNFGLTNIDFSAFILATDAITVTFFPYESPQSGTLPDGVVGVGQYYWKIVSSSSISFFGGAIKVPISALAGVTDPTKLVWLKRTNSGDVWTNLGGEIQDEYLVSTVSFDSFSEFAIGTTNGSNPLPVELTSFEAKINNNKIYLMWVTAQEINNHGFEIEKATVNDSDNLNFVKIGFIAGKGNSNVKNDYLFIDDSKEKGKFLYRLKQLDLDGASKYSTTINVDFNNLPISYSLEQNYPNPFNPSTVISFSVPTKEIVKLSVFNLIGEEIATLINNELEAGWYKHEFNASSYPSGVYFYKITAGKFTETKKMVLVR